MQNRLLWLLFSLALLLRVFLASFGTLETDFYTFFGWSQRLIQETGFVNFYNEWSDYLPGYLYVLAFLGWIHTLFPQFSILLLYKLPAILADLGTGFLIFQIVKGFAPKLALLPTALYLFNPAIFANSSLWGQVDGIVAMFALAGLAFLRNRPFLSSAFLALGTLVKPQVAFIVPLIILIWIKNYGLGKSLTFGLFGAVVFVLGFIPFAGNQDLFPFIFQRLNAAADQYPYTSVNAFNLWAVFPGFWQNDSNFVLLGLALYGVIIFLMLFNLLKTKKHGSIFLAAALLFVFSFLFLTRMHERHLLPAFAPLAVAAASYTSLWLPYVVLSIVYVANLYFSFTWITEDFRWVFPQGVVYFLVLASILAAFFTLCVFLRRKLGFKLAVFNRSLKESKKENLSGQQVKSWLLSILLFAFISRVVGLWHPATFYFDEVYHAFTAREMLRGNPASWEWWSDPPEGFAYEWTHPPLAKLFMALGMFLFGQNPFGFAQDYSPLGWRLPGAIFGTVVIFLVYLLGKKLFGARTGLLAAAIMSLDGLLLVMSRVGMNDIYFLFFALLTILFFLESRFVFAAISLGLALSTKWAAFWIGPVLLLVMFIFKIKPRWAIFWFPLLVPVVYLLSYIPFFLSGHTIDQFIELQKQMWWYHTGLTATHPYQSSWWSWPLMLRPIWLFTDSKDSLVANIYAMGNPFIFWGGLAMAGLMGTMAMAKRQKELLFVVVSWGLFFLPWAFSPRIMFFYHYLPALPFLALGLGWLLSTQRPQVRFAFFVSLFAFYLFFLPHWTGIYVPRWLDNLYYWLPSWR